MKPKLIRTLVLAPPLLSGLLSCSPTSHGPAQSTSTLAERLGFPPDDKLLIITADDVGIAPEVNTAVLELLEKGAVTSASIIINAPAAEETLAYAKTHPEADMGVHLTLTAEWEKIPWGPVLSKVPSLIDARGFFHPTRHAVYGHADLAEVEQEAQAQIYLARRLGLQPTHLTSHMGVFQFRADYFNIYLNLAKELDVPLRMVSRETQSTYDFPNRREMAGRGGILSPDYLVFKERENIGGATDVARFYQTLFQTLESGVTEIYVHPTRASERLETLLSAEKERAAYRLRVAEYEYFRSGEFQASLNHANIRLIGYRQLLTLQRETQTTEP